MNKRNSILKLIVFAVIGSAVIGSLIYYISLNNPAIKNFPEGGSTEALSSKNISAEHLQISIEVLPNSACLKSFEYLQTDDFASGEVLVYFSSGASIDQINRFLESINSDQRILRGYEIPILEVRAVYSEEEEKPISWPDKEKERMQMYEEKAGKLAEAIKAKHEEIKSYGANCCFAGYPLITFKFIRPLNQDAYQKIEESLRAQPELSQISPVRDEFYLDYFSLISDSVLRLKVPINQEKEFACKITAMNEPIIQRVGFNLVAEFLGD